MHKKDTTKTSWQKVAKLYDHHFFDLRIYDESYDVFCDLLSNVSAPRILDIGCGPGIVSKYILQKLPNSIVHGIDYAPAMIDLAKENIPNGIFWVSDVSELNTSINIDAYDGVVCGFVIPYLSLSEIKLMLKDISKILLRGGVLYLSFVQGNTANSKYISGSTGDKMFFYYHDNQSIIDLFLETNFSIKEQFKVSYKEDEEHTIFIAEMI